MRKLVLIASGVLLALVAVSQFTLPPLAESQIEKRLTEEGGVASADLSAFPAVRLLFEDGGRIGVSGSGLELELDDDPEVFSKLDGFDEVDLNVTESDLGPLEISRFSLQRSGDGPYTVRGAITTTASDVAGAGAESFGIPGSGILEFFAGQAKPLSQEIPIAIDMQMESDEGKIEVTEGGGSVAGLRFDAVVQFVTAAIVVRI